MRMRLRSRSVRLCRYPVFNDYSYRSGARLSQFSLSDMTNTMNKRCCVLLDRFSARSRCSVACNITPNILHLPISRVHDFLEHL